MTPLDVAYVGPLRMRLLEQASPLEPEFFAPRYYLDLRHNEKLDYTAIKYLGHDRGHAERKFVRHVDNAYALQNIEKDDGS